MCRARRRTTGSVSRPSASSRESNGTSRRLATPSSAAACSQLRRRSRVLAVDQGVLGAGVHDQQREVVRGQVERHLLDRAVAAVEQDRVAGGAAQRRRLVHAAGRGLRDGVLGVGADRGEPGAGRVVVAEAQPAQVGQRHGDGALERGRARQAGTQRHVAVDDDVGAGHLVPRLLQGPEDPGDVGRPARRGAGRDVVEGEGDLLAGLHGPARARCGPGAAGRRRRCGAAARSAGRARRCSRCARR